MMFPTPSLRDGGRDPVLASPTVPQAQSHPGSVETLKLQPLLYVCHFFSLDVNALRAKAGEAQRQPHLEYYY